MKKKLLFILIPFLASNAIAQITLTSSNSVPQIGDALTYIGSLEPFDFNHNGANQVWDFSSFQGNTGTTNVIALENSLEATFFTNANIVQSSIYLGLTAEAYYKSNSEELSLVGQIIVGHVKENYFDQRELLKFPITYNNTFNETFAAEIENAIGQIYNRSGSSVITADGYGDLILPYTTINNVLRIRAVSNYSDVSGGETAFEYVDTVYSWYDGIHHFPLASASVLYNEFIPTTYSLSFISEEDFLTGINDNQLNHMSFYPNPAKDFFYLQGINTGSIEIYDLRGVLVKKEEGKNQKIDVSDLRSGMYIIKSSELNYSKKLVIK